MTLTRRAFGGLVSGAIVAGTGCLGFILGDEAQKFEASPATISAEASGETGYEQASEPESEEMRIERTVEGGGQERDIVAVNYISQYEKTVEFLGQEKRAAVFIAFSTPEVEILGKTLNPVGEMDNKKLIEQAQGKYEGLTVGNEVGTRETELLGSTVDITKFEGSADLDGTEVPVYIHVGQTDHDGDIVIPIAVYPQMVDEEPETYTNITGIEH
ncbi:DUF6517 family protein [Halostella pelagica]|uniref:DUF6517 family protein n=1 Tax=Halostella pelagica TaxID=2583824 RepID=UPI0010816BEB|nr:DUF6517 family protein [Halostella pelagica]